MQAGITLKKTPCIFWQSSQIRNNTVAKSRVFPVFAHKVICINEALNVLVTIWLNLKEHTIECVYEITPGL